MGVWSELSREEEAGSRWRRGLLVTQSRIGKDGILMSPHLRVFVVVAVLIAGVSNESASEPSDMTCKARKKIK